MTDFERIIFLEPVCTKNIWGGNRLGSEMHYLVPDRCTGECWGISAAPGGEGIVKNGAYRGMGLAQLWKQHPEMFGNRSEEQFPLLTKIIDAKEDLSIQVHPDDNYAREHENGSLGKTECWYILDCPEDAKLVLGHNAETREEMRQMISEKKWDDFVREVPVKKGDFIQIDPGTVHAITAGFLILETQQNSNITYRLYDYDRLSEGKPRELHINKSLDVISVPAVPTEENVIDTTGMMLNKMNLLYSGDYYRVFKIKVEGKAMFSQEYPFLLVSVCEGKGTVNGVPVERGSHFILPNGFGEVEFNGDLMAIASTVAN